MTRTVRASLRATHGLPAFFRDLRVLVQLKRHALISDYHWYWTGAKRNGYGLINVGGKMRGPHRVLFEIVNGPVPAGFELDHKCRERSCIRADHQEVVTHAENIRRGFIARGGKPQMLECDERHREIMRESCRRRRARARALAEATA